MTQKQLPFSGQPLHMGDTFAKCYLPDDCENLHFTNIKVQEIVCVWGWGGAVQGRKHGQCLQRARPPKHQHRKLVYAPGASPCLLLQASVEIPGLQLSNQDYFPYVYFHIDLSLLD